MSRQLWLVMQGSCAVDMLDAPSVLIMPISASVIRNIQKAHSLVDDMRTAVDGFSALELDVNATYYAYSGEAIEEESETLTTLLDELSWFVVADLPIGEERGLWEVSVPFLKPVPSGGDHLVVSKHGGLGWSAYEHYCGYALSDIAGPSVSDLAELLDMCEGRAWRADNVRCRGSLV